jgi:hypothetical protein
MMGTGIRTASVAVATVLVLGLTPATAHAGPNAPSPPEATGTLYGDPAAAARFWRHQQYDDDCVPMAVADVVGQLTGDQPTEEVIVAVAHSSPQHRAQGTDVHQAHEKSAPARHFLCR